MHGGKRMFRGEGGEFVNQWDCERRSAEQILLDLSSYEVFEDGI